MRMSDRITFVTISDSYYDPNKGEYVESEPVEETKPCKLSTVSTDRTNEFFGENDIQVISARLQQHYLKEFDHVLIKNGLYKGKYQVKRESNYRKGVFYMECVK